MKTPGTYIIRGGAEGKKRLEVLARVMWPTTSRLLVEAGLAPGMTCLDLGCGGGDVSLQLAASVGPRGYVIGVDMDEIKLDLARQTGTRLGQANVQFRRLNVQDWDEESQYDFIYCRFLLTHLADPLHVLWKTLKPVVPFATRTARVLMRLCDFTGPRPRDRGLTRTSVPNSTE